MDSNPILLVTDSTYSRNPFGAYLGEILKTEGFSIFQREELGAIDSAYLRDFPLVVLAEVALTESQRDMFRSYVSSGGKLLAMRPDPELSDLFGLDYLGPNPEEFWQYLVVDTETSIGRGLERGPLQYHGAADRYRLAGASAVAWLHDTQGTDTTHPAVSFHRHGSGQAVAFAYDLARSVALSRQGNPDWACGPGSCDDGDGVDGIRPVDAFFRQSGSSWVDPSRVPIPQADEQQRLLSNCLMALSEAVIPLPRLWYLPAGKRAVLVMTGDGDEIGFEDFDSVIRAVEEYGGHFSAYIHLLNGDPTREQVNEWVARGHEVSLHVVDTEGRLRPTWSTLNDAYDFAESRFVSLYGRRPGPTERNHCVTWYGWSDGAEIALAHGMRVDFNAYHGRQWGLLGEEWVNGYFTGSGLPQRFVKEDGKLLDMFQILTQWADEAQLYRQKLGTDGATRLVEKMLDRAQKQYPTVFVANFHPGGWKRRQTEPWARNMMAEAVKRDIPIWSGEQLSRFIDVRDSASFSELAWDGARLGFILENGEAPRPLAVMLPARVGERHLKTLSRDGDDTDFIVEGFAGRDYAFVQAASGRHRYLATYAD